LSYELWLITQSDHYIHHPLSHLMLLLLISFNHFILFFFNDPATTEIYTLSLHDALPISRVRLHRCRGSARLSGSATSARMESSRSEEHTSELQSRENLVCRLLLEKKKKRELNRRRR